MNLRAPDRAVDVIADQTVEPVVPAPAREPEWAAIRPRRRPRNVAFWLASIWLGIVALAALLADLLPLEPYDTIVSGMPPRASVGSAWPEILGTDGLGRSMTSRLVFGARQTVAICLFATAGSMLFGTVIGVTAGYFRGKVEAILNVILDAMLSIPPLVLLLTVAAVGRRDVKTVIIGLIIVGTPTLARLARANTIRVRNRSFVTAARAMGARTSRIIVREVMPIVLLNLASFAFLYMGIVVVVEGTMSFLGLGVPAPSPSWGGMINDGRKYLHESPHLVFIPAICMVFTVVSLSTIGDRLRRHFDSRRSAL